MNRSTLVIVFDKLSKLGLVETKRQFSTRYLGRASGYLIDHTRRAVEHGQVAPTTVSYLRARLRGIAAKVPNGLKVEIESIVEVLDCDMAVAKMLAR